jgi:hypothetical protein
MRALGVNAPADEGMLVIRRSCSGPSAMLKTMLMTVLLFGAGAAIAQAPEVQAERTQTPSSAPPSDASTDSGYHDLICKPNGTEDGFDCADTATPAKIVPIPSQVQGPRSRYEPVSG